MDWKLSDGSPANCRPGERCLTKIKEACDRAYQDNLDPTQNNAKYVEQDDNWMTTGGSAISDWIRTTIPGSFGASRDTTEGWKGKPVNFSLAIYMFLIYTVASCPVMQSPLPPVSSFLPPLGVAYR